VRFHVDLVGSDVTMTCQPEEMPALARVAMPDLEQHGYRVYPLVGHIADKVAATFDRYGNSKAPSTRYKDLVDLVAIVTEVSVKARSQTAAQRSEAKRRQIALPQRFGVPARNLWDPGYAAEAGRSLLPVGRTLDDALEIVTRSLTHCLMKAPPETGNPTKAAGCPSESAGRRRGQQALEVQATEGLRLAGG
jgi:hypothetical protein